MGKCRGLRERAHERAVGACWGRRTFADVTRVRPDAAGAAVVTPRLLHKSKNELRGRWAVCRTFGVLSGQRCAAATDCPGATGPGRNATGT